jgi:hypothetical protein
LLLRDFSSICGTGIQVKEAFDETQTQSVVAIALGVGAGNCDTGQSDDGASAASAVSIGGSIASGTRS